MGSVRVRGTGRPVPGGGRPRRRVAGGLGVRDLPGDRHGRGHRDRPRASAPRRRLAALAVALGGHRPRAAGSQRGALRRRGCVAVAGVGRSSHRPHPRRRPGRRATCRRVPLAALVCTGAFVSCAVGSLLDGGPHPTFDGRGWSWLALLVLVSTIGVDPAVLAGLARVGRPPRRAAVILRAGGHGGQRALVFHESLTAVQVLGGLLCSLRWLLVQWPSQPQAASERFDRRGIHGSASPFEKLHGAGDGNRTRTVSLGS